MEFDYRFDPHEILGAQPGSSLLDLRDAYREKAKKYHPDHGGDEWAFRVVSRAYEVLGTARVAGRAAEEFARSSPPPPRPEPESYRTPPPRAEPFTPPPTPGATDGETLRPGVRVNITSPTKVVDVELFLVRYLIEDPVELVTLSAQDRNLSCCLHVAWPSREVEQSGLRLEDAATMEAIAKTFQATAVETRGAATRSCVDGCHFVGWLYYPTAIKASDAFQALRKRLVAQGLGVAQWTREMVIPRE